MDRTSSSWHQHIAPLPPSHTNRELLLIPKNNPLLQQLLSVPKKPFFKSRESNSYPTDQAVTFSNTCWLFPEALQPTCIPLAQLHPISCSSPPSTQPTSPVQLQHLGPSLLPAAPPASGKALSVPPFHTGPISPLFLSFLLQPVIGSGDSPHI